MRRGLAAVKQVKEEMDQNAGANSYVPHFTLEDGESAIVGLTGDRDQEPVILEEHSIKQGNNFTTIICSADRPKFKGKCVSCHTNASGNRQVNRTNNRAAFNVYDFRLVHPVKNKEKSKKYGRDIFDKVLCTGEVKCKRCRNGKEPEYWGEKQWKLSMTWAAILAALNDDERARCKCGGKITVTGYLDPENDKVYKHVDEDMDTDGFEEILECSKCEEPDPYTIFDFPIKVRRSGKNKSTAYAISIVKDDPEIQEIFDALKEDGELKPADLEKINSPLSLQKQAELIGVVNPYSSKSDRSEDYDDDEEEDDYEETEDEDDDMMEDEDEDEDDEDDDDDDDEDDPPRRPATRRGTKKKAAKKPTKGAKRSLRLKK